MTTAILPLRPNDAAALAQLMHRAIHEGAAASYTPEQLRAWSPAPMEPEAFIKRVCDGRKVWVAFDEDAVPKGFIELETSGHIDLFYCHPAGAGTGQALYAALEAEASARGLTRLSVEASEMARPFFERSGFERQARRLVLRRGVLLHHFPMTKTLGHAPPGP